MFDIKEEKISTKYVLILIAIAYLFSILVRMIWVYQFNGLESFYWNNQLMINTNDGYYFATTVKDFIYGTNPDNPQLAGALNSYPGMVYSTWFFAKILPVSLDTIILYMPAFISSLIVIPMILIMRLFNLTILGFLSALLGSIAWSYYNRTMVGYYDSDMFAVLMQFIILYSLLLIIVKRNLESILLASVLIIVYPLFYPQGLSLIYAMYILLTLYMLLHFKKENISYIAITMIAISLIAGVIYVKLPFVFGLYFLFKKKNIELKYLIYIALIGFLVFLLGGNVFGLVIEKVTGYLDRGTETIGLQFFQVIQTVREAGKIPFETMANRISGSQIGVIAALIGYVFLVIKHRPFLLALPLIGIGVFSLWGGLRFTVYAVPIAAISSIFLFYVIGSYIVNNVTRYILIVGLTAAMIYPNITHIIDYKVPTVFTKSEVQVLDTLKSMSNPKDYTVAWWDYGYPLWYYTNTNTLIDGGKHHNDNFIVSQILTTTSQTQAANLARLSVETYVKSDYKIVADTIFKNKQENQLDPNLLLEELEMNDYILPQKTRDVFLYLPNRMMGILPTVSLFSNIDLTTGTKKSRPLFFLSRSFKETQQGISLGSGVYLHNTKGQIQIGKDFRNINNFVVTEYDRDGILKKNVQTIDRSSSISVIYMKNYNTFLVLDNSMFNSTYVQLFVLENYNQELFEPVILNPHTKVYKLKI